MTQTSAFETDRAYTPRTGPVRRVQVSPRPFPYHDFPHTGTNGKDYAAFRASIEQGTFPDGGFDDRLVPLCVRYLSQTLDEAESAPSLDVPARFLQVLRLCGGRFPVLARYIPVWIADYCFLHGKIDALYALCRTELAGAPLSATLRLSDFTDAFFGDMQGLSEKLMACLPDVCAYDMFSSRFYREHEALYRRLLPEVLLSVLDTAAREVGKDAFYPPEKTVRRSAYAGLVCRASVSGFLEIAYCPFTENERGVSFVTGVVKYTDNLIRQGLGSATKLTGIRLPAPYRKQIAALVRESATELPVRPAKVGRKPKPPAPPPSPPEKPKPRPLVVDFDRARSLENESWKIAALFSAETEPEGEVIRFSVGENGVQNEKATETPAPAPKEVTGGEDAPFLSLLTGTETAVLFAVLRGEDPAPLARKTGAMPLGVIAEINDKAIVSLGDILIEETPDGGFAVPEDFREELASLIEN